MYLRILAGPLMTPAELQPIWISALPHPILLIDSCNSRSPKYGLHVHISTCFRIHKQHVSWYLVRSSLDTVFSKIQAHFSLGHTYFCTAHHSLSAKSFHDFISRATFILGVCGKIDRRISMRRLLLASHYAGGTLSFQLQYQAYRVHLKIFFAFLVKLTSTNQTRMDDHGSRHKISLLYAVGKSSDF